jgi:hypothetical protein
MNLQFYETIQDKSKEYMTYLLDQISPKFTTGEFKLILDDLSKKSTQKNKESKEKTSESLEKLVIIGSDKGKLADLTKMDTNQRKILFQIFISRELNDKIAVKWRFYQHIKYQLGLNVKTVKINTGSNPIIDFVIETNENEKIFVSCHDILEINDYNTVLNGIPKFIKSQNLVPDKIIFSSNKSFRNIPIEESIELNDTEITPELWIEWIEENISFDREDLLIINNSELKLAGFNFTNTEDLLNYIYQNSNGGQISIFKQSDFYTETSNQDSEIELVWKGIMIK